MLSENHTMTVSDLARHLGIARSTAYNYVRQRFIPGIKVGSRWRFNKGEVDKWIEENNKEEENPDDFSEEFYKRFASGKITWKDALIEAGFSDKQSAVATSLAIDSAARLFSIIVTEQGREALTAILNISQTDLEKAAVKLIRLYVL